MFFLRPNATWLQQGQQQGVKPFRASAEQKGPLSSLFFTLSPRQKAQLSKKNRRASDALGPRVQMAASSAKPFFVSAPEQPAQGGRLIYEYSGDDWTSPEEALQLTELNDSADSVMSELSQTDRDLAALSAQAGSGQISADLSLTAQQTFTRIDALMQRWNLRAEEIERNTSGTQWVAFNPATGSRFQQTPLARRAARQAFAPTATPTQSQPAGRSGDARRAHLRHEFGARPQAPAVQIKHRRLRIAERYAVSNTEKLSGLRQQMNQLAAKPQHMTIKAGGLRRIALARLASLHGSIDHMAHELHDHREHIEFSIKQRMDRRRGPRAAAYPAPVLKPKTKDDTTT